MTENSLVYIAGEDIKQGDYLVVHQDGKVYRSTPYTISLIFAAASKDTKAGEKITLTYPVFGEGINA